MKLELLFWARLMGRGRSVDLGGGIRRKAGDELEPAYIPAEYSSSCSSGLLLSKAFIPALSYGSSSELFDRTGGSVEGGDQRLRVGEDGGE